MQAKKGKQTDANNYIYILFYILNKKQPMNMQGTCKEYSKKMQKNIIMTD